MLAAVKAKHCGLNEEEMPGITFALLVLTNFLLKLVKTHKKLVKISEFVKNSGKSQQMLRTVPGKPGIYLHLRNYVKYNLLQ